MRRTIVLLTLVSLTLTVAAQQQTPQGTQTKNQKTKYVLLSPKSTIDTAEIVKGFAKGCSNVVVTTNESKADYVLEATAETRLIDGTSYTNRWHFTLMNHDGDVVWTMNPGHIPPRAKRYFEEACRNINQQ